MKLWANERIREALRKARAGSDYCGLTVLQVARALDEPAAAVRSRMNKMRRAGFLTPIGRLGREVLYDLGRDVLVPFAVSDEHRREGAKRAAEKAKRVRDAHSAERRRELDRLRCERKRRKAGKKTRAEYLAEMAAKRAATMAAKQAAEVKARKPKPTGFHAIATQEARSARERKASGYVPRPIDELPAHTRRLNAVMRKGDRAPVQARDVACAPTKRALPNTDEWIAANPHKVERLPIGAVSEASALRKIGDLRRASIDGLAARRGRRAA